MKTPLRVKIHIENITIKQNRTQNTIADRYTYKNNSDQASDLNYPYLRTYKCHVEAVNIHHERPTGDESGIRQGQVEEDEEHV